MIVPALLGESAVGCRIAPSHLNSAARIVGPPSMTVYSPVSSRLRNRAQLSWNTRGEMVAEKGTRLAFGFARRTAVAGPCAVTAIIVDD